MRAEVIQADLSILRQAKRDLGFNLVRRLYLGQAHRLSAHDPLSELRRVFIGSELDYEDAIQAEHERRFIDPHFAELWYACRERYWAFERALDGLRNSDIAEFQELPKTVREVALNLYEALRWADLMNADIQESEGRSWIAPGIPEGDTQDRQASILYSLAHKNVAEYERNYAELTGGIERTKAQAAVYITTLDALRLKMLSYRHVGRDPSLGSHGFLSALAEARAQLTAIDHELDEMDISHYPTTAVVEAPRPMVESER